MNDYMVRGTAAGAHIRILAARSTLLVEKARQIHKTSPVVTAALGRLLTAGCLMGSFMKSEEDRLTLNIHGDGPVCAICVTADNKGHVKGFVGQTMVIIPANAKGKLDVAGAIGSGYLNVIRDTGLKEPYSSTVELISGEIAEDLTYYFASSEQIPSSVGLGVLMSKENTVAQAGGFIIQLMPGVSDDIITQLEDKLAKTPSVTQMLENGLTPEDMVKSLLTGLEPEILESSPVSFSCNCNEDTVKGALIAAGRRNLEEMIADNKDIEIKCRFCGHKYTFSPEELKTLTL
jgi:molecular chaperone Hsp33